MRGAGLDPESTLLMIILLPLGLYLAFINGANSNFKGLATLYGSNVWDYRTAARIGAACILLGGLASLVLAPGLISLFSSEHVPPAQRDTLALAVIATAAAIVTTATWLGLPVSTTHALTGGLIGVSLVADSDASAFIPRLAALVVPLAISPFLAAMLSAASISLANLARARTRCETMGRAEQNPVLLERLHMLSGCAVSVARAVNDVPKFAGAMVLAGLSDAINILLVAAIMSAGALFAGARVARTISVQISHLAAQVAPPANFTTAAIVFLASLTGLSVATTQVSVGSIIGAGISNRSANWRLIGAILTSWLVILPLSGLVAATIFRAAT